jgi:hypothetical protein
MRYAVGMGLDVMIYEHTKFNKYWFRHSKVKLVSLKTYGNTDSMMIS